MTTDYIDYCPYDTPVAVRRKLGIGDIFINQIQCLNCKHYIRSKHRHDYRTCRCGATSIDGGSHYSKIITEIPEGYKDHTLLYKYLTTKETK